MKKDKYTKTLAKNQVCEIFQLEDIGKNGLPKFKAFVWKRHVGVPFRNSNMAAGTNRNICFRVFLLMREYFA